MCAAEVLLNEHPLYSTGGRNESLQLTSVQSYSIPIGHRTSTLMLLRDQFGTGDVQGQNRLQAGCWEDLVRMVDYLEVGYVLSC